MKKYILTDSQVANIKIFMNRTNLSGEEVPAFTQIVEVLNSPRKDFTDEEILRNVNIELLKAVYLERIPTPVVEDDVDVDYDDEEQTKNVKEVKMKVPRKR